MKRIIAALTSMALVIGLTGCSASGTDQDQQSGSSSDKTIEEQLGFTDRDRDPSYDEASATKIALDGSGASVTGKGATADGSTVTISADGTYVVSGTLTDGQIVVSLPGDNDKAQIVLDGRHHPQRGRSRHSGRPSRQGLPHACRRLDQRAFGRSELRPCRRRGRAVRPRCTPRTT